jgi:NIPSNAP
METQLRDYRIYSGQMEAWLDGWRNGVRPLREQAGFRTVGAWMVPGQHRFVWLLEYTGAGGFGAADERYYASVERAAVRPDPAELIERSETVMVTAVG